MGNTNSYAIALSREEFLDKSGRKESIVSDSRYSNVEILLLPRYGPNCSDEIVSGRARTLLEEGASWGTNWMLDGLRPRSTKAI